MLQKYRDSITIMSTRSLSHIIFIAFALALAMSSGWNCRKDVEEFRPFTPSMEGVDTILKRAMASGGKIILQKGGGVPDTIITTKNGIRLALKDTEKLFVDDAGKAVPCSTCKTFNLEMTEVARRGDAIGRGINTLTTDGRMLESGGILFLEAICDGKKLSLKGEQSLQIQIPSTDLKNTPEYIKYQGIIKEKIFIGWEKTEEKAVPVKWANPNTGGNQTEGSGYELKTKKLDWIMLSRPIAGATKPLVIEMPQGFNGGNTQAYVVLKSKHSIAKLEFDAPKKSFVFRQMPVGEPATVVTIGRAGTKNLFGNLAVDAKADLSLSMKIVPREATEQQILDFLNSL
jgi:hypothetical protein